LVTLSFEVQKLSAYAISCEDRFGEQKKENSKRRHHDSRDRLKSHLEVISVEIEKNRIQSAIFKKPKPND